MAGCNTCCCGGCWESPHDGATTTAFVSKVQGFCCKCVPKYLCASITPIYPGTGSGTGTRFTTEDDATSVLLDKFCPPSQNADTPIQYTGNLNVNGSLHLVVVRFNVSNNNCVLEWTIDSLDLSGSRLIDPNETGTGSSCQKIKACVDFGGTWSISANETFSLSVPETLDISKNIKCGTCKCMCKCLCMSVASRSSGGSITIEGSNQIVCATIIEDTFYNCSETEQEVIRTAVWEYDGWKIELSGNDDWPFSDYTVLTGTEQQTPCEDITKVLRFNDNEVHTITAQSGNVVIEYESSTVLANVPISFLWMGQSNNSTSATQFQIFNWSLNSWQFVKTVKGRQSGSANRVVRYTLKANEYGVVDSNNVVKIRIITTNATALKTDLLRLKTTECCALTLTPKPGIVLPGGTGTGSSTGSGNATSSNSLEPVYLSSPENCPSVFKFWNFLDAADTEWYVTIDCSWCNNKCGTVATSCCEKPVPRSLVAEVFIDCPTCTSPFSVLLNSTTGSLWEGVGLHCNQQFNVSFACSGTQWQVSVSGAGACSFFGTANALSCDPLYVVFNGQFGGGIGCCGVGSMDTSVPISITVFQ